MVAPLDDEQKKKKKEFIWISSNEMDETGAHYTEWSKPERKFIFNNYHYLAVEKYVSDITVEKFIR